VTTCSNCRYRIPAGQVVSWCPGCGQLFDVPVAGAVAGAAVERSAPPAVTPSAPVAGSANPTQEVASAPVAFPPGWSLVLLRAGERLDRFPLRRGEVVLGRTEGDYTFQDDPLLSARHARLYGRGRSFWLEDAGSRNGTFLRLAAPAELRHGDVVTFGGLVLRYESDGVGPISTSLITTDAGVKLFGSGREKARGRLVRILQDGSDGPDYPLTPSRTIVGRKLGHFLFPEDPLLSRQHAQFYERDGEMWVEDLGSSNGTMLRLRGPAELSKGTVFRIGDVTLEVVAP
jgi:pSer/pThr/pTyr-binding forkhead associated (FHA) protein